MRGSNSLTLRVPQSMICTPDGWASGNTDAYRYCDIVHKFAENSPFVRWDAGATGVTPPNDRSTDGWPAMYVVTLYNTLSNAVFLFNFARVLRCDITIEWLGQLTKRQGAIRQISQVLPDFPMVSTTGDLEVTKFGTTLLAKICHERFDRNRGNGTNALGSALAPVYTFGWDHEPIINSPDRITTIDDRGTTPSGNLKGSPGVRLLRFTPERRIHKLSYKPLNRLDKAGATVDLVKLNASGAAWDEDMRSGVMWLGQERPLAGLMTDTFGAEAPVNTITVEKTDYFRVTYNTTVKFFGQARNGQNNENN